MAKLEIDMEQTARNLANKALQHEYLGKTIRAWADELAKKIMPRRVNYESDGFADGAPVYDVATCPSCDYLYEEGDKDWLLPFCPNCGQALEWNITEDEEGAKE